MTVQLIVKNSSVEDRRPTAEQLANGEISLNYNSAGPFLCCIDEDGTVHQIGGVKLSNNAPADPVIGTIWLNLADNGLYIWDGNNWIVVGERPGEEGTNLGVDNRTSVSFDVTSSTGLDATLPQATVDFAGLQSAADKTKIDGITAGAEPNVQSDWSETNTASDAFIQNKPTLLGEAPLDGSQYVRQDGAWELNEGLGDAPNDGTQYVRQNQAWAANAGITEAPNDGQQYARQSEAWSVVSGGASVEIGDNPPASPNAGDLWWDSVGGNLFIWYTDNDSSQWVSVGGGSGGAAFPAQISVDDTAPEPSLTIDADGNVGIAVTDPDGRLTVQSNDDTNELRLIDGRLFSQSDGAVIIFESHGPNETHYDHAAIAGVTSGVNDAGQLELRTLNAGTLATKVTINEFGAIGVNGSTYGTNGQVLQSQGAGNNAQWVTPTVPGNGQVTINQDGNQVAQFNLNDATNTTVNLAGAGGSTPIGGIILWSGTIANIPATWQLCDGTNGTPDLRARFVVGAEVDGGTGRTFNAATGAETGQYGPNNTGGSTAHQLTIAEMPSHNHPYAANRNGSDYGGSNPANGSPSNGVTSSTGGDNFHENRPPFYALAYIMRIS